MKTKHAVIAIACLAVVTAALYAGLYTYAQYEGDRYAKEHFPEHTPVTDLSLLNANADYLITADECEPAAAIIGDGTEYYQVSFGEHTFLLDVRSGVLLFERFPVTKPVEFSSILPISYETSLLQMALLEEPVAWKLDGISAVSCDIVVGDTTYKVHHRSYEFTTEKDCIAVFYHNDLPTVMDDDYPRYKIFDHVDVNTVTEVDSISWTVLMSHNFEVYEGVMTLHLYK